jgi:hypothetical protein
MRIPVGDHSVVGLAIGKVVQRILRAAGDAFPQANPAPFANSA